MNVISIIAIVARAQAHIWGSTINKMQHLVAFGWSARRGFRPSLLQLSHVLVLGIGLALVMPALAGRPAASQATVTPYAGSVLWNVPVRSRNAPEFTEAFQASAQPAPTAVQPVAPTVAAHKPLRPAATPAPKPVPPPGSGGSGLAAIYAVFGNSPGLSWALRVANCESHYNPLAVNRSSGASGLFQFMPSTWNANFPGQNIWDPMAQARGALVFYNAGRQSAWTCK